jgi:hypothetical protein
MARWHRMEHPKTGEVAWTDTPSAYGDWTETATASRPPGDHEDKLDGKWVADEAKRAKAARRAQLKGMHRDELVDHIESLIDAKLKAHGLIK